MNGWWRQLRSWRGKTVSSEEFPECFAEPRAQRLFSIKGDGVVKSLALLHVAAGGPTPQSESIARLASGEYECERFGLSFVTAPAWADILLVTGPLSREMVPTLRETYARMVAPKWVIAVGDAAESGGSFHGSYALAGALSDVLPVSFTIPGRMHTPLHILGALLELKKRGTENLSAVKS